MPPGNAIRRSRCHDCHRNTADNLGLQMESAWLSPARRTGSPAAREAVGLRPRRTTRGDRGGGRQRPVLGGAPRATNEVTDSVFHRMLTTCDWWESIVRV